MSSSKKIWLGVLTFLPLVLTFFYFIYFFSFFFNTILNENGSERIILEHYNSFFTMIIVIVVGALISLGVMIYYIIHVSNNKEKDTNTKIMWIVLLVFVSTIASIIYYFVEIVPLKPSEKSIGYTQE